MSAAAEHVERETHFAESRAEALRLLDRVGPQAERALTHGSSVAREALVELVACGFTLGRAKGQLDMAGCGGPR